MILRSANKTAVTLAFNRQSSFFYYCGKNAADFLSEMEVDLTQLIQGYECPKIKQSRKLNYQ